MDDATRQILEDLAPDESLGQCISRYTKERISLGVPLLDRFTTFNKTDVLELCGQTGAGKTEMLYSIAISHILPKRSSQGLNIGGCGHHVVYLDLDYKFDIFRVSNLLQSRIENLARLQTPQGLSEMSKEDIVQIVTQAFEKLHVFTCKNSIQLAATLKILATDFVPQLYNHGEYLGVIILDNIGAYWDLMQDLRQGTNPQRVYRDQSQKPSLLQAVIRSLSEIQSLCEVPIVVSRRLRGFEEVNAQQHGSNTLWKDFTTKSVCLERLGSPTTATNSTNIGYKIQCLKPDIRHEIKYEINSSGGCSILT